MTIFTVPGTLIARSSLTKASSTPLRAADRQRAEGAELGDMAVEVHRKRARRRVAQLGRDLVPDALALVHRHALFGAPFARHLMQLLFLRSGGRNHVVDEQRETLGPCHLVDADLTRLLEEHIGIAREVVGDHEVGLGKDFFAGLDATASAGPGEDLLGHRLSQWVSP